MSSSTRIALVLLSASLLTGIKCNDVGSGDTLGRFTLRISVSSTGSQALGDNTSASMSADGRFVAFDSTASNLTNDDSNTARDVFVKDRLTGAVERVSVNTSFPVLPSLQRDCGNPSISADGRYVAFEGIDNLAGSYSPGIKNIYVHDRVLHETRAISGNTPNLDCEFPSIARTSAGLIFVAFRTKYKAFTGPLGGPPLGGPYTFPPDRPGPDPYFQIWVAEISDPLNMTIRLVSTVDGTQNAGTGDCGRPVISADGSVLVFQSDAGLDSVKDLDANTDVYLVPTGGGAPELITLDINGLKMSDGANPCISGDGRYIAFVSMGNIDSTLPFYPASEIILRDRTAPTTILVSKTAAGAPADLGCGFPTISGDGQRIAYTTTAPNLLNVSPLSPPPPQIFLSSPSAPLLIVSLDPNGGFGAFLSRSPVLSGNRQWVAWHTASGNLVVGDTNFTNDIFVDGPLP